MGFDDQGVLQIDESSIEAVDDVEELAVDYRCLL